MLSAQRPDERLGLKAVSFLGDDVRVPCLDGTERQYVNLDSAASTPALGVVAEAVNELLPWYSSVHRGAGAKSQVSTAAFEGARDSVRDFLAAADDQVVVFVENTTHAANLLSWMFPQGSRVLSSPIEHHANMLPWRRHHVELLPFTSSPDELLSAVGSALSRDPEIDLVAVTGASNVTGEVWPIADLATLAHEGGAEIFVDAAQLAPHRAINLKRLGVDHLAISGHKLYAPFGAGALVARTERLMRGEPWVVGGGAVKFVTVDDTVWAGLPERHEAGSPNTLGIVALGVACDALSEIGMDSIAASEKGLTDRLRNGIADIPGLRLLKLWPETVIDRVGVATFVSESFSDRLLAQILAAEYAIGVRSGRFCSHPLVTSLLNMREEEAAAIRRDVLAGDEKRMPGAVRASIGLASRPADVDRLLDALSVVTECGPAFEYSYDPGADEYRPTVDHRKWPTFPFRLHFQMPEPSCDSN